MSRPVLDLTKRHFTRELGDLTVIGTWIGAEHEEAEPCIVLIPARRKCIAIGPNGAQVHARPCCVALSAAYLYDDPRYLLRRAMEFSQAMGFEDTMTRTHKIAEILHESLDDLCKMPEKPVFGSRVAADATLTHANGRRETLEILHND